MTVLSRLLSLPSTVATVGHIDLATFQVTVQPSHIDMMRQLCEAKGDVNHRHDRTGESILMRLCRTPPIPAHAALSEKEVIDSVMDPQGDDDLLTAVELLLSASQVPLSLDPVLPSDMLRRDPTGSS